MSITPTLPTSSVASDLSPLRAIVSLHALTHNVLALRQYIHPTCEILAIIKADAYGHGVKTIANTLTTIGTRRFGVATVQEGVRLRNLGITQPILVMGGLLPSHLQTLLSHSLTPVLSNEEILRQLADLIEPHLAPYPVHLKIDTGMRRLGFPLRDAMSALSNRVFGEQFHLEGIMTHLADADNPDPQATIEQLKQFQGNLDQIQLAGHEVGIVHAANSAGVMYHPSAHFSMVRPGLMLYGIAPRQDEMPSFPLHPVMKIITSIVQIQSVPTGQRLGYNGRYTTTRPSHIAILPVGYAHGYPRSLSNRGKVLINGQRAPIVGNICMDMMLVDVTEIPHAELSQEVVLMGRQGNEEISASELAEWAGTIPYEILCTLGSKASHTYKTDE